MTVQENGFAIVKGLITPEQTQTIIEEIDRAKIKDKHGIRNADKKFNAIKQLIESKVVQELVASILGTSTSSKSAQLVRAIFFDKTPDKNWLVTWHQDKTVAFNTKTDIANWGPWSFKDGVHHVQPDISVLNQMITLRIHLDDSDNNNGCLKVIPKSHMHGILTQEQIAQITASHTAHYCEVNTGDTLLMRPLLLHSSSKSTTPKHRRVIHLEFSNYNLPHNLHWA